MLKNKTYFQRVIIIIGSFGGIGLAPKAPGTVATIATLPIYWLLAHACTPPIYALLVALLLIASVPICTAYEKALGAEDPPTLVLDEVCGLLITMLWIQPGWLTLLLGLALFRLFDILKPFPIHTVEKRLPGGLGVMADDVVAAIFANLALRLILHLIHGIPL